MCGLELSVLVGRLPSSLDDQERVVHDTNVAEKFDVSCQNVDQLLSMSLTDV